MQSAVAARAAPLAAASAACRRGTPLHAAPAPRRQRAGRCAAPARAAMAGGDKAAAPPAKRWPEEVAPTGVALPPVKPTKKLPVFGFVDNAERMNSRAAMIGFFALLLLEAVAGNGLLDLVGIETGNGIDIGF